MSQVLQHIGAQSTCIGAGCSSSRTVSSNHRVALYPGGVVPLPHIRFLEHHHVYFLSPRQLSQHIPLVHLSVAVPLQKRQLPQLLPGLDRYSLMAVHLHRARPPLRPTEIALPGTSPPLHHQRVPGSVGTLYVKSLPTPPAYQWAASPPQPLPTFGALLIPGLRLWGRFVMLLRPMVLISLLWLNRSQELQCQRGFRARGSICSWRTHPLGHRGLSESQLHEFSPCLML